MADQKNSNQLVRELKRLDANKPDPSITNIQELRGRNVDEELQAPSIRPLPPGLVHVQNTFNNKNLSLLLPIDQSTPAPVTKISPKSSSDLDTDQGEAVDETLRTAVPMFNQTLLTTIGRTPNGNIGSNNDFHEKIIDHQLASILDTKAIEDNHYLCKRTLTMQTQLTKLGMIQSKMLKEIDKLFWV